MTIENFLTMTVPYKFKSEPWTKVCTSEDWGLAILPQIGGKQAIGEQFHYMIPTAPTAWAVRWWR